ncbi:MAG: hypothetical protein NVV59_12350 [Chitinophagaceae bacterium]|nr:hypothetical protein [Chitinophagaceae bacterium]
MSNTPPPPNPAAQPNARGSIIRLIVAIAFFVAALYFIIPGISYHVENRGVTISDADERRRDSVEGFVANISLVGGFLLLIIGLLVFPWRRKKIGK